MQIDIVRRVFTDESTIGDLFVDQVKQCLTLEDPPRDHKISGKTAIPAGTYQVVFDFSNRFKREMLHILNVPNFVGVRIHAGNTAANTEGCVLVGYVEGKNWIGGSKMALAHLEALARTALRAGQTIQLTIK